MPSSAYVTVETGLGETAGPLIQDTGPDSSVVEPAGEYAEENHASGQPLSTTVAPIRRRVGIAW
jgi:hypothetical protein